MLSNLFLKLKRSDKLVILKKSERVFVLASSSGTPAWQLRHFILGGHGNFFIGQTSGWKQWQHFFISKGGVAYVFAVAPSSDIASDLIFFQKFGAKWVVPKEQKWFEHVPTAERFATDLEVLHQCTDGNLAHWFLGLGQDFFEVQNLKQCSFIYSSECTRNNSLAFSYHGNILDTDFESIIYKNF